MRAMTQHEKDWQRLASHIRSRRDELGFTQLQLAEAASVSLSTVQLLEAGEHRTRLPRSLPHVEAALRWAPGSASAVLLGGEATVASAGQSVERGEDQSEMPLRVQRELRRGKLVDSQIIEGPGDSRFVVLWQAGPDVNADELSEEDVAAWSRVQRELHGLPHGDE